MKTAQPPPHTHIKNTPRKFEHPGATPYRRKRRRRKKEEEEKVGEEEEEKLGCSVIF